MRALYDAVAERVGRSGEQIEAAIGQTQAGAPSDAFWSAYDDEVARLESFFRAVEHEPVVQARMKA